MSYGTPGIGTSPHLSMELLKSMAGIDILHVPYRGTARRRDRRDQRPDRGDVRQRAHRQAAGRLGAACARWRFPGRSASQALPGRAAGGRGRRAGLRGDAVVRAWSRRRARRAPIVARLNAEAIKALHSDEMKEKLALDGAQPVGSTPGRIRGADPERAGEVGRRVARAAGIDQQ